MHFILSIWLAAAITPTPTPTPGAVQAWMSEPRPWNKKAWMDRHEAFLKIAATGKVNVLFLGDSITDYWQIEGEKLWESEYVPLGAANFGISGDRTQFVLWRIQNGELEGIHPKVTVLMIGTNNVASAAPESVARAITEIVKAIQTKLPHTQLILLGILPRGAADDPAREKIVQINQTISALDDGRRVHYLDMSEFFVDNSGELIPGVMRDGLHLSPAGYQLWADAMRPLLQQLLRQ